MSVSQEVFDLVAQSFRRKSDRIEKALEILFKHGQVDGDHHQKWVNDQIVRALLGSEGFYKTWIKNYEDGADGPVTYEWDVGIAP